jgi:hypothetical protein
MGYLGDVGGAEVLFELGCNWRGCKLLDLDRIESNASLNRHLQCLCNLGPRCDRRSTGHRNCDFGRKLGRNEHCCSLDVGLECDERAKIVLRSHAHFSRPDLLHGGDKLGSHTREGGSNPRNPLQSLHC